jgi:hypothetical protein
MLCLQVLIRVDRSSGVRGLFVTRFKKERRATVLAATVLAQLSLAHSVRSFSRFWSGPVLVPSPLRITQKAGERERRRGEK